MQIDLKHPRQIWKLNIVQIERIVLYNFVIKVSRRQLFDMGVLPDKSYSLEPLLER